MIRDYKDLKVYQVSYDMAMELFWLSKGFPKEELYSLTSQIVRSSRSISSNISEGWAKRRYINLFRRHLIDSIGSCDETKHWLDMSRDCTYMTIEDHDRYMATCVEISKMLYSLHDKWQNYDK